MTAEIPSGFVPLDKVHLSSDIKPSVQPKKNVEQTEKMEFLPSSDRVQLSEQIEQSHSKNTYQLTVDHQLNQYVLMLKQAEMDEKQIKENGKTGVALPKSEIQNVEESTHGNLNIQA